MKPMQSSSVIEEPLADDGILRLFLAVERIPGLDRAGDLAAQLEADRTAPALPEAMLAPVGGDRLVVGGAGLSWLPVRPAYGMYGFQGSPEQAGGHVEFSTNYVHCQIISPLAGRVVLSFGSDDAYKIMLNRRVVASRVCHRTVSEDADQVPLDLVAGANDLLIRVDNYGGGSGLFARILGEDLRPRTGLQVRIRTRSGVPEILPDAIPAIPAEDETFFGARLPRTMSLLAASSPQRLTQLRILVYGQSITAQRQWTRIIRDELHKRHPDARIIIENRAIGGHTAPRLAYSAINDLYPAYPDLVLFHVYDGEHDGTLERIVSELRRRTTAEMLMWTDHLDLDQAQQPRREEAAAYRRMLAAKYGIELVEAREMWKRYLGAHGLVAQDLLADNVHLNHLGESLLGHLVLRHLRFNVYAPAAWGSMVRTYEAAKPLADPDGRIVLSGDWRRLDGGIESRSAGDTLRLAFTGNRVDLTAPSGGFDGRPGTARVLIDGRPPSQHPGCRIATRARCDFANDSRPGFRYVRLGPDPAVQDWTLRISRLSEDLKTFDYEFIGSVTGPDGSGSADVASDIVSASGQVAACGGFNFKDISHFARAACGTMPTSFTIGWKVLAMATDVYAPCGDQRVGETEVVTLIQGIANGDHTLELVATGDDPLRIGEITIHSPPLR